MSLPAPAPGTAVLVTGAANGIGAELARALSERGHDLFLVDRQRDRLAEVAGSIEGVQVTTRVCDLTKDSQRGALVAAVRDDGRRLVGLCNNAGIASYGRFHELPYERELEMVRVNVVAVHHLTGSFLGAMVRHREGAILNVASLAANQPIPTLATYAASKAFVHSFSEALHAELRGTGVSVTSLCPGGTATEIINTPGAEQAARLVPDWVWASAEGVARAGVRGMERGRRTVVPGLANRIIAAPAGRFVPRSVGLPVGTAVADATRAIARL